MPVMVAPLPARLVRPSFDNNEQPSTSLWNRRADQRLAIASNSPAPSTTRTITPIRPNRASPPARAIGEWPATCLGRIRPLLATLDLLPLRLPRFWIRVALAMSPDSRTYQEYPNGGVWCTLGIAGSLSVSKNTPKLCEKLPDIDTKYYSVSTDLTTVRSLPYTGRPYSLYSHDIWLYTRNLR